MHTDDTCHGELTVTGSWAENAGVPVPTEGY